MRILFFAAALALPVLAEDVAIDNAALTALLEKKGLKPADVAFDFEHLDSMPPNYVSSHSNTKSKEGQLAVWRRAQREPLTLPIEVQAIAGRVLKGEIFEVMAEAMDRPPVASELPAAEELADLPEAIREPIGVIVAAIEKKDAALIWKAIVAARPALEKFRGTVEYAKDGVVVTSAKATPADAAAKLTVRFGGDDTYNGAWAGAEEGQVRVLIDTGGNDAYVQDGDEAAQGAAGKNGIGILADFAGNDTYKAKAGGAQGAADHGVGVLWDAAGDDRYEADSVAQGSGWDGIGVLIDAAGNDRYLITTYGQACAGPAGFGLLLDRAGDDVYHARDSLYGEPVTEPAPQDEKHNANCCQGSASGQNGKPFRAGGVALLLDVSGDDTYEAGCWSQGTGYFQAIGALVDLAGNDSYHAWVYIMGTGAHGGFGCQLDARGDDLYTVGGWNGPAMSVDYGMGIFIDALGNDRYVGCATGLGCSIGLGISIFQDGSGDDVYEPKDDRMGSGVFYEQEDYNNDGKVTPAEKRHWGLFLDCGGSDRYPKGHVNGARLDRAEFSGCLDVSDPRPDLAAGKGRDWDGNEVDVTADNWESIQPADLLKLMKGDDAAKAEFALRHGLFHEGSDLLAALQDPKPLLAKYFEPGERTYNKDMHLFATADEAAWAPKLAGAPDPTWPGWAKREAAWRVKAAAESRRAAALAKVRAWLDDKDVKALFARKKDLDALRAAASAALSGVDPKAVDPAFKKLAQFWAGRKAPSVPCDLKSAAADLNAADPAWAKRYPEAAANATLDAVTLETVASTLEERAAILPAPNLAALGSGPRAVLQAINDERQMLGRAPLAVDDRLLQMAAAQAKGGKGNPKLGFDGESVPFEAKGSGPAQALADLTKAQVNHAMLLDGKWLVAGVAAGSNNNYVFIVGKKK